MSASFSPTTHASLSRFCAAQPRTWMFPRSVAYWFSWFFVTDWFRGCCPLHVVPQARKVGLCDAQTRDRVGPASELLDQADAVHVYDHHVDKDSDIVDAVLHIQP